MNTPNKLSLLRIFLVPVMMFFYLETLFPYGKVVAIAVFIFAALTDMIDGYIARKYNLVTDLGKLLDTNADKILVLAALLMIVCDGTVVAPWGVIVATIIIGRDMIISAFRQIAASKNFVMAADKWGKIKAIITYVALPMFFLLAFLKEMAIVGTVVYVFEIVCYVLLGIATIFTIFSAVNYIVKNRSVIKEK